MKHISKSEIRIMMFSTGLVFLLLVFTMVISNVIVMISVHTGLFRNPANTPLLTFLIQTGFISILIGTVLTFVLSHLPLRPLNQLIQAIHRVAEGNFETKINFKHPKEFRELADCFNQMTEELAGIEMLRSDFVNNFSHEFKTPIVSILGFANLLKKGNLSEAEHSEYLDIMISECKRLSSLSTNVLNLSKVESLSLLTDVTEYNAGEQVREAILLVEPKWNAKNISFDLDIEDIRITANLSLLQQVWVNLIDNAVKFSQDNSTISIGVTQSNHNFIFTIKDNGIGMNTETLERIFDKFYQGDLSHSTEGNGLGLPLVWKIIKLHHGSVKVSSHPGKGSIFVVTLPVADPSN